MRALFVVAIGGAIGAGVRWATIEIVGVSASGFPWATFAVNVIGCVLIGLAAARLPRDSTAWMGVAVGALGGLTTFSAFSVETRSLLDQGHSVTALVYVGATLAAGIGATELALGKGSR